MGIVRVCAWTAIAFSPLLTLAAQQAPTETAGTHTGTPSSWAEAANKNELAIVRSQGNLPLRYRERKVNAKGDTTREIVESEQGNVARLIERDGQPITQAEDAAERSRLEAVLASPDEFAKHHKRAEDLRTEALELIPLLPQAMLYTFAPDQPQPKDATTRQVVLDYTPNPAFHPPTMVSEALTGMEGRVWIDEQTRCITRIEAHVLHTVDFGFGILAKIYPGGSIVFEQAHVAPDRWVYSHLEEHLTARVLMVKTLPEDTNITSWDFHRLPSPMSYQQAIQWLLAMPVSLQ